MSRELFQKLHEHDHGIMDMQKSPMDPELGEKALQDLSSSVSNLVFASAGNFDDGNFQTLYNLLSSAITAFGTGVTKEHIVQALQEGWKKGQRKIIG